MAISVRERIGELAVLKAIGYGDRTVLFLCSPNPWQSRSSAGAGLGLGKVNRSVS